MNYPDPATLPTPKQLLKDLVSIGSLNPDTASTFSEPYGEAKLIHYLADFLRPWADRVEVQEVLPARPNLIAYFNGKGSGRTVALEAHADTVGIAGMSVDPFGDNPANGDRFYGRGACDDKGPMVAMLLALLRHLAQLGRPAHNWCFISTCDEELGGKGARHLMESGLRCDGIIVAEPTELIPLEAHKGALRLRVEVEGIAGHSAYPSQGANAIQAAAALIHEMENWIESQSHQEDSELGPLTMSVGTIEGGDQVNRIPDSTTLQIDFRLPPNTSSEIIVQRLASIAAEIQAKRNGIKIKHQITQSYPPFKYNKAPEFAKTVLPLYQHSQGVATKARYATNAGFYSERDIPCIVWGPGSIKQAHTADEWIDVQQIESAIGLLQEVIRNSP